MREKSPAAWWRCRVVVVVWLLVQSLCWCVPQAEAAWAPPGTVEALFTPDELRNEGCRNLLETLKKIEKGANVNKAEGDKRPPLIQAAALRHRLAICYLVAKKANVSLKDKAGKTALDYVSADEPLSRLLKACADENKPLSKDRRLEIATADDPPEYALRLALATWGNRRRCADILDLVKYGVPLNETEEDCVPYLEGELPAGFNPEQHPGSYPLGCFLSSPEHIALLVRLGWNKLNRKHRAGSRFSALPACLDEYSEPEDARLLLALGLEADNVDTRWLLAVLLDDMEGMRAMLQEQRDFRFYLLRVARSAAAVKLLAGAVTSLRTPRHPVEDYRCRVYGRCLWGNHVSLVEDALRFNRGAAVLSALLEAGVDIPGLPNNSNMLHLVASSRVDDGEPVPVLVKAGMQLEQKKHGRYTPLHVAVMRRNLKIVQALLAAKADPNAQDGAMNTPLHLITMGNVGITLGKVGKLNNLILCREKLEQVPQIAAELIKAGANVNARNKAGETPLQVSIHHGYTMPRVALTLLEAGAKAEADSLTHLHDYYQTDFELDRPDPEEMGRLAIALMKAGARPEKKYSYDVFSVDQYKFMLKTFPDEFVRLSFVGNVKLLDYLLKSPKEWISKNRRMGYHGAIERCNSDVIKRLVEKKVPVVSENGTDAFSRLGMCNDHTGYWVASEKDFQIVYEGGKYSQEQWTEVAKLLAKGGGNPDQGFIRPAYDNEAWRNKTFIQSARVVNAIIAAGGNPNAVTPEGVPVIRNAKTPEALRAFAAAGADINVRDELGNSLLMRRIITDAPDLFKMLLRLGADTTIRNNAGQDVYALAKEAKEKNNKPIYLDLLRTYAPVVKKTR